MIRTIFTLLYSYGKYISSDPVHCVTVSQWLRIPKRSVIVSLWLQRLFTIETFLSVSSLLPATFSKFDMIIWIIIQTNVQVGWPNFTFSIKFLMKLESLGNQIRQWAFFMPTSTSTLFVLDLLWDENISSQSFSGYNFRLFDFVVFAFLKITRNEMKYRTGNKNTGI